MTTVSWVTAFIDLPPDVHEAGTRFWSAVTAYAVSPPRGGHAEFTTLLPPVGDPFLKIQRTSSVSGPPGLHLDLHVTSAADSAARAEVLGAQVTHRSEHGFVVLRSPGGFVFCLVHESSPSAPGPRGGRRSTRASSTRCVSTSRPRASRPSAPSGRG